MAVNNGAIKFEDAHETSMTRTLRSQKIVRLNDVMKIEDCEMTNLRFIKCELETVTLR